MIASEDNRCNGCKHQNDRANDDWCYMFEKRPDNLPCGQHDKFAELRRKNGALWNRNRTQKRLLFTGDIEFRTFEKKTESDKNVQITDPRNGKVWKVNRKRG